MATIARLRVAWTGVPTVGASVSTFHLLTPSVAGIPADFVTFFTAIRSLFPTGLTWTIPNSGDLLEDSTGALTGGWSGTGGGAVTSNGGAVGFGMGVGARIRWNTGGIFRGRRVRGTTFFTSLSNVELATDGTPSTSVVNTFQTAANVLIANVPELAVWSRPVVGGDGETNLVTDASVPDTLSWLRSRRT